MKPIYTCFLILILLQGCTIIDRDDYLKDYTPSIPEGADVRFVLLEDYTGIRCKNCPSAAALIATLSEVYGKRLIPVSIHAGYYARPINGVDLQTVAGNEYDDYFQIKGYPQGIVNRRLYKEAEFYPKDQWSGAIESVPERAEFGIELHIDYSATDRSYTINTDITRFESKGGKEPVLIFWLVEDNIITPQMMESGETDYNYCQRHVFRGALNNTWGESVALSDAVNIPSKQQEKCYILPEAYEEKNCSIVALLCDRDSKEILQVKECSLTTFPTQQNRKRAD